MLVVTTFIFTTATLLMLIVKDDEKLSFAMLYYITLCHDISQQEAIFDKEIFQRVG